MHKWSGLAPFESGHSVRRTPSEILVVVAMVAAVGAVACGVLSPATDRSVSGEKVVLRSVTGTVTYEMVERAPDSVLEIYLVTIPRAGTSSTTIGERVIRSPAHGSQSFEVEYPPEDIEESMRYAIQARLVVGDELKAMNTVVYTVLTRGGPSHVGSLVLDPVGQIPSTASAPLWQRWSEVPAPIASVNVTETYRGYSIHVVSYLPNGCYKFKGHEMSKGAGSLSKLNSIRPSELSATELINAIADAGFSPDVYVTVTNLSSTLHESTLPVGCAVGVSFVETEIPLRIQELRSGETYNIFVNGELATTFTPK